VNTLAPFVVHTAGNPVGPVQHCTTCRFVVMDHTARFEGRAMIPDSQPDDGPSWWPFGALVATDKTDGSHASITYVLNDRGLADDERLCAGAN
jgi:hypothetical protein